jgi:hypothetical protein
MALCRAKFDSTRPIEALGIAVGSIAAGAGLNDGRSVGVAPAETQRLVRYGEKAVTGWPAD